MGRGNRERIRGELGEGRGGGWRGEQARREWDRDSEEGWWDPRKGTEGRGNDLRFRRRDKRRREE